jgi:hypothetical protein
MRTPFLALAITGFLTGGVASTIRTNAAPSMNLRTTGTHLGVPLEHFGNFESSWVNPGADVRFHYDWYSSTTVTTPADWSFVVTDIMVTPIHPTSTDTYVRAVVMLSSDNLRQFEAIFRDDSVQSYHLTSGMVIPPNTQPKVYNDQNSEVQVQVQLLGYYIKGTPQDAGVPPQL